MHGAGGRAGLGRMRRHAVRVRRKLVPLAVVCYGADGGESHHARSRWGDVDWGPYWSIGVVAVEGTCRADAVSSCIVMMDEYDDCADGDAHDAMRRAR